MTKIIERLLSRAKDFINKTADNYSEFQRERKILNANFDELFRCTSDSIFNAVYVPAENYSFSGHDSHVKYKASYADFLQEQSIVYHKLNDVTVSVNRLEDILSDKKDYMDARSAEDTDRTIIEKPSKFKSFYISTVAGMGTASRLYGLLRNNQVIGRPTHHNYSLEHINAVLDVKHRYFWKDEKQLIESIYKEKGISINSIDGLVREAMYLKVHDPQYQNINSIDYDTRIASTEMKDELIDAYIHSDRTLKEISMEFERKYGMHVSVSTISRNAKKHLFARGLDFRTRRDTKKYYYDGSIG